MQILTLENKTYDLNHLPEKMEDDIRFAVLDNNTPAEPDFFYVPLIFLESFNSPAIVLNINGKEISMPVDWNIVVGCQDSGMDLEVIPLTSISDRGFDVFMFNPLTSFVAEWGTLEVTNFYNDVKWYFPRMKNNQMLAVPLTEGDNPKCAFFCKDVSRQSELIDYGQLL
jgi:hypothetical protein